MDALTRPEHVLLQAIRMLHERGAHRINDGRVWIGTDRFYPLPPGDSLRRLT